MTTDVFDADVIVAGAGPSGLVTACEIALGGGKVIVLEKRNGPTWSRAGNLTARVLEIFASRGFVDKVMGRAYELHTEPRGFKGIWAGLRDLHYEAIESDYPFVVFLAQLETEKLLAEQLKALGGDLRLQHEVIGVEQDGEGVTVAARAPEGGETSLRARYLVGADGNKSAVREAVGISFTGHPAARTAVNVDAIIPNPYPENTTVFHSQNGWAMAYPLSDKVTRLAFIDAATMGDTGGPPDLDAARAMLRRVHGSDFGITEVQGISRFHDAMFMVDRLREGRVFLVGESVRIHYPASGVGMNFCIQDAFNLGWKLAAVVTGLSNEALLDSYESERRPEIEKLLDDVRRQCAIQFNFDLEHEALKNFLEADVMTNPATNKLLCENLAGISARYAIEDGAAAIVGRRFPNLAVRTSAGTEGDVFGLLGDQSYILLDLTAKPAELPASPHPAVKVVSLSQQDAHVDFEGLRSVLIRPDGHVVWVGSRTLAEEMPMSRISKWLDGSKGLAAA